MTCNNNLTSDQNLTFNNSNQSNETSNHNIKSVDKTIFLYPTTQEEIFKIIKSLNNTTSTGFDELPTKVLKYCALILSDGLSYLINLSFTKGKFPETLKVSVITKMTQRHWIIIDQ